MFNAQRECCKIVAYISAHMPCRCVCVRVCVCVCAPHCRNVTNKLISLAFVRHVFTHHFCCEQRQTKTEQTVKKKDKERERERDGEWKYVSVFAVLKANWKNVLHTFAGCRLKQRSGIQPPTGFSTPSAHWKIVTFSTPKYRYNSHDTHKLSQLQTFSSFAYGYYWEFGKLYNRVNSIRPG